VQIDVPAESVVNAEIDTQIAQREGIIEITRGPAPPGVDIMPVMYKRREGRSLAQGLPHARSQSHVDDAKRDRPSAQKASARPVTASHVR
jgi:hypothetical protein